jgi:hypothetical protein
MQSILSFVQAPGAVVMVRPQRFHPNPQTAVDNGFRRHAADATPAELAARAHDEAGRAAGTLRAHGVRVHLFDEDPTRDTPDADFPNNSFSTHAGGRIAVYPMYSPNRRRERRADIRRRPAACAVRARGCVPDARTARPHRAHGPVAAAGGADHRAGRRLGAVHAGGRAPGTTAGMTRHP